MKTIKHDVSWRQATFLYLPFKFSCLFDLGTGVSCIAFVGDGLFWGVGRCFSGYEASLLGARIPNFLGCSPGGYLLDLQKCCCLHYFIAQSLIPTYTHLLLGEVPKGLNSSYYVDPKGRDTNQSAEEESKCTELLTYEIDNTRKGKIPIHVM